MLTASVVTVLSAGGLVLASDIAGRSLYCVGALCPISSSFQSLFVPIDVNAGRIVPIRTPLALVDLSCYADGDNFTVCGGLACALCGAGW